VGIKEASGSMAQMVQLRALCGDDLPIYSGEDGLTVPMMSMGGAGAISVLSNVAPKEAVAMSDACLAGDFKTAAALQCRLLPLIDALFSEVNPIPAKAAVAAMGFGQEFLRLPLTSMEDHNRENLYKEMRKLGINV
jgi:4-hydroxy-tetrahydrodipicolinate synthase